jgi:hypothetical protein
VGLILRVRR